MNGRNSYEFLQRRCHTGESHSVSGCGVVVNALELDSGMRVSDRVVRVKAGGFEFTSLRSPHYRTRRTQTQAEIERASHRGE